MAKRFSFSSLAYINLSEENKHSVLVDKLVELDKNTYIIGKEDVLDLKKLEQNLSSYDLSNGFLFFDLPNFSNDVVNFDEVVKTILKVSNVSSGTKIFALHNKYNHFENHEFEGLERLNNLIAKNFPKNESGKEKQLYFPNVLVNNASAPVIFSHYAYDLNSVKKASMVVNHALNKIRQQNLSPYESFLAAYSYVASFEYNEQGNVEDFEKIPADIEPNSELYKYYLTNEMDPFMSRTVVNSLNTGLIVCATYADMLALMCNRLNETMAEGDRLKALSESVEAINKDEEGNDLITGHRRVVVNIVDKKHNIKGLYLSDPTNNSVNDNFVLDYKEYIYHAIPITKQLFNKNSDYVSFALGEPYKVRDGSEKELESHFIEEGFVEGFPQIPRRYDVVKGINSKLKEVEDLYEEKINNALTAEEIKRIDAERSVAQYDELNKLKLLENRVESLKKAVKFEFMVAASRTEDISPQVFVEALANALPVMNKYRDPEVYAKSLYVKNAEIFKLNVDKKIDTFDIEKNKDFYNECEKVAFKFDLGKKREMK